MKRFLIVVILFFIPILCGLGILEYGMRSVPNDYSYKNKWLKENMSKVHIWALGSSHGLYGIHPTHFSKPAFNSAHVSQPPRYDAFIFNKFIKQADSLEWLILPISYFTFISVGENWREKNYCIYYNCPYHTFQLKYHSEVIGNQMPLDEQRLRVKRYKNTGESDMDCDSLGHGRKYAIEKRRANGWYLNGHQRVQSHTQDLKKCQSLIRKNTACIEKIIQTCAKKQVKVLLVTTPVCHTYYEGIDSTQYALMVDNCNQFVQKYDNVYYLNLLKDSRFVEDDFYDADHLESTYGAAKLTKILDEYMIRLEAK